MILTVPNFISLLRIPLAFVFLQEHPIYRAAAILAALLTDGLDGYIARQFKQKGRVGTLLDPITDKFFVFFVLFTLISENRISPTESAILICRDFSVILYGFYLAWRGRLFDYQFRAIWCGKITTVLQFTVLLCLALRLSVPSYLYGVFIILGILALGELYKTDRSRKRVTSS
ncbi:MAG: CDP-alcohol phosphatidyltransferase family protein [Parachlamydia sp.]|nr:CDP-alcohol phosphatidyltransferase family protein [Parachlamydia sp.]